MELGGQRVGNKLEVRWPKVANTYEKTIGKRGPDGIEVGSNKLGPSRAKLGPS